MSEINSALKEEQFYKTLLEPRMQFRGRLTGKPKLLAILAHKLSLYWVGRKTAGKLRKIGLIGCILKIETRP